MEEIISGGLVPQEVPAAGNANDLAQDGAAVLANYSPLALAFLGDAVYELEIREHIVRQGNASPKTLNDRSSYFAMARTQSLISDVLAADLSEEEADIFRRCRNANANTRPKHASPADYHKATGLEALIGYLHLCGRNERVKELVRRAWEILESPDTPAVPASPVRNEIPENTEDVHGS